MKKNLFTILFLASIATNLFAQSTTTSDSLSMTIGTAVDVYYNLQTGKKDTVSNRNWHLAFAVRNAQPPTRTMQAATVLINEGRGVSLYETNKTLADWNNFDTTGWNTWKPAYNSDSSWDVGAFNKNRDTAQSFDYGWGMYNMTSRDVSGSKIYLIAVDNAQNPFGTPTNFRKICIQKIVYDTQWVFTISKLDGTDSNTVTINKKDFTGKLFAYYNMNANIVIDREPIPANQWNLLFTRYKALVTLGPTTIMYPVMGVLQNMNTMAYKLTGSTAFTANYDTMKFIRKIRTIDWDWKVITTSPGEWPIVDTTVYFTKNANQINKIKFTRYYAASDRQVIVFNKTKYDALAVNEAIKNKLQVSVYPNPATENLFVELDSKIKTAQINISDLSGKSIINTKLSNQNNIDISGLQLGMYMLTVSTENGSETVKFIKQ
jgi:hypothetical protein